MTAATQDSAAPASLREDLLPHLPALHAYARSLSRNASIADDLVQDTVLKAWSHADRFQPGTNLRAWLFVILRNTFVSYLRHENNERYLEHLHPDGVVLPAHDGLLAMRDVTRALARMTPDHRDVIVLIAIFGMTYGEAARTLWISQGTVKSRMNRARAHLLDLLHLGAHDTPMPDAAPPVAGAVPPEPDPS